VTESHKKIPPTACWLVGGALGVFEVGYFSNPIKTMSYYSKLVRSKGMTAESHNDA
jgi:hypothetical protein